MSLFIIIIFNVLNVYCVLKWIENSMRKLLKKLETNFLYAKPNKNLDNAGV